MNFDDMTIECIWYLNKKWSLRFRHMLVITFFTIYLTCCQSFLKLHTGS